MTTLFLALLVVFAFFLGIQPVVACALFTLGLNCLSRAWTWYGLHHIDVVRTIADRAFTGEEVAVRVTVSSSSRLPLPWVEIDQTAPLELFGENAHPYVCSMAAREEQLFEYTRTCRRRGLYELGSVRIRIGDVLGIKTRSIEFETTNRLLVYPRVVPLQGLRLRSHSAQAIIPSTMHLLEDSSRILGIRDYQHGDSHRHIHWSASARLGRVVVKQYQPAVARETLIAVDLNPENYLVDRTSAMEQGIVTAASLAAHTGLHQGLPIGLAVMSTDPASGQRRHVILPAHSQRDQLTRILEVLASIRPTKAPFVDLLRSSCAALVRGSTIVVITGTVSQELQHQLLFLRQTMYTVTLIVVQPKYLWTEAPQLAGMTVHRVWTDEDLVALQ